MRSFDVNNNRRFIQLTNNEFCWTVTIPFQPSTQKHTDATNWRNKAQISNKQINFTLVKLIDISMLILLNNKFSSSLRGWFSGSMLSHKISSKLSTYKRSCFAKTNVLKATNWIESIDRRFVHRIGDLLCAFNRFQGIKHLGLGFQLFIIT